MKSDFLKRWQVILAAGVLGGMAGTAGAAPVTLPYVENFTSGAGSFTPATAANTAWSAANGKYRATLTAANAVAAATVENSQTAGGFRVAAVVTQVAGNHVDNSIGLGFLAGNATLSGGAATPYYLVDVKPATNSLRLIRIESGNTFLLNGAPLSFPLDSSEPFQLSVDGTYAGAALTLSVKVQQGEELSVHPVTEAAPLQGRFFGLRCRAGGTVLTAEYEDFSLTQTSTVTLSGQPPGLARPGNLWQAVLTASSTAAGAAPVFSLVEAPTWVTLTPEGAGAARLSGTPSPAHAGANIVRVRAVDANGAAAEQTYHVAVLGIDGVVISEFMAENDRTLTDAAGEYVDWLELCNAGGTAVDLQGWGLSDDPAHPLRWVIPPGVVLPPLGMLRIFASSKNLTQDPAQLHTDFRLSNRAGGYLALTRPDGSVADAFTAYPEQKSNISFGRWGSYLASAYLLEPTPGQPNSGQGFAGFTGPVAVSLPRGVYQTPQSATLTAGTPDSTLVYTLDGSTPALTNGTVVPPPGPGGLATVTLPVAATSILRTAAFRQDFVPGRVETRTWVFPADVITQSPDGLPPPGWPAGPINGQVLDYGMDPDITGPAGSAAMQAALASLPSFSLVTDRKHLLDPVTGIYVNPYGREEEWERPVSVELLNADGTGAFQIDAGIRLRGGFSRTPTNPKHGFHLYFRGSYGATHLDYPLFGDKGVDRFDRIDLRCTQGGSWHHGNTASATYLKDEWCRATSGAMGQAYTRSRYVHLFLNGQYWGLHTTQERADNSWAASYFGGKKEDYDVIKTYVLPHRVEVADGDGAAWQALHTAATAGFAGDAAYFAVLGRGPDGAPSPTLKPLVELDPLIDYMILHQYTGNTDGPVNPNANVPKNFYCFRPRDGSAGFRFVAHDCEDTMAATSTDVTGTTTVGPTLTYFNPRWLHQQLAANARYRLRFADRVQRHFFNGGALETGQGVARWNAMRAEIAPAMLAESARWGDAKRATPYTVNDWIAANNNIVNSWFPGRRTPYFNQLRTRGLWPSLEAPAFSQHGGRVPSGYALTLTGPPGTALWFTVDGTDPSAPAATVYQNPILLTAALTTVKARAKNPATGEWSALTEALFTLDALPAAAGRLAISEIHYNPPGSADNEEFIELLNLTNSRLDLAGVSLTSAVIFQFPAMVLEPGQRVVLVENEIVFRATYGPAALVAGQWSGALNNTTDTIIVLDAGGLEIERVTYSEAFPWPVESDGDGRSLVRIQPTQTGDAAWNWRAGAMGGGKPGAAKGEPFAGWLTAGGFAGPLAAGPHGVTALVRYATALDVAGAARQPDLRLVPGQGNATLTFSRRLTAADEILFTVESSGDGADWQSLPLDGPAATAAVTSRRVLSNGTEEVTVSLPVVAGRLLARVKMTVRP